MLLAGHPPPYLVRAGHAATVGEPGRLLGFDRSGGWTISTVRLEAGDLLVLYTDGVTDAGSDGERFGEERLAQIHCRRAGCRRRGRPDRPRPPHSPRRPARRHRGDRGPARAVAGAAAGVGTDAAVVVSPS